MKIIRLTENDLKKVISESAKRIIREMEGDNSDMNMNFGIDDSYGPQSADKEDFTLPFDEETGMPSDDTFDGMPDEDMEDYMEYMKDYEDPDEYKWRDDGDISDGDLYRGGY